MAGGGEAVEVRALAGGDAGEGIEAEHPGGIVGREAGAERERRAGEVLEVADGAVQREDGAGEGFGRGCETAEVAGNFNVETAQGVAAVSHAGGGDAVGDEDGVVWAFGAKPEADEFGSDVDAVGDDLGVDLLLVEDGSEDAGFAVVERAHGVEGVGCGGGSGADGGEGLGGGCVGVAERDADAGRGDVGDEVDGSGELGGEGEEADVTASGGLEAIEEIDRSGLEEVRGMDAAFPVREERAFEVDADGPRGPRFSGSFDRGCKTFEAAQSAVDGGGDGGGEEVGDAAGREEAADGGEGGGGRFHDVVAGRSVGVDVEKGGGEGLIALN